MGGGLDGDFSVLFCCKTKIFLFDLDSNQSEQISKPLSYYLEVLFIIVFAQLIFHSYRFNNVVEKVSLLENKSFTEKYYKFSKTDPEVFRTKYKSY